jgi:hypothetical protein
MLDEVTILFRGRKNAHHDRGREILQNVIASLEDVAKVEKPPGMEGGRSMTTILAPPNIESSWCQERGCVYAADGLPSRDSISIQ